MEMGREWVAFWCERPRAARSWLHPRRVPEGLRGSVVASVSGVEGGGRGWRLVVGAARMGASALPHPMPF